MMNHQGSEDEEFFFFFKLGETCTKMNKLDYVYEKTFNTNMGTSRMESSFSHKYFFISGVLLMTKGRGWGGVKSLSTGQTAEKRKFPLLTFNIYLNLASPNCSSLAVHPSVPSVPNVAKNSSRQ